MADMEKMFPSMAKKEMDGDAGPDSCPEGFVRIGGECKRKLSKAGRKIDEMGKAIGDVGKPTTTLSTRR